MLSVRDNAKIRLPKLALPRAFVLCLPEDYDLSLVFVGDKESHQLNLTYRKKDKPTNVLSFPLDKHAGEIFINPGYAKKEAVEQGRDFAEYLTYLFIHGCLHLKGMTHGSKMNSEEQKILRALYDQTPNHRPRRRHLINSSGRIGTSRR